MTPDSSDCSLLCSLPPRKVGKLTNDDASRRRPGLRIPLCATAKRRCNLLVQRGCPMIASNPFVSFRDSFSSRGSGRDWLSCSNFPAAQTGNRSANTNTVRHRTSVPAQLARRERGRSEASYVWLYHQSKSALNCFVRGMKHAVPVSVSECRQSPSVDVKRVPRKSSADVLGTNCIFDANCHQPRR